MAFTRGEVRAEGPVESWLVQVEQAMRDALYDNAKKAVNEYPRGREESIRRDKWLWDYPAQVWPIKWLLANNEHITRKKYQLQQIQTKY